MPNDSFADPVWFNAKLNERPGERVLGERAPFTHEPDPVDTVGQFLAALRACSDEIYETTATQEGCDQYLPDHERLMGMVININIACHRIAARAKELRKPFSEGER